MKAINKIKVDLDRRGIQEVISAVQTDAYSRDIEFTLFSGGVAWAVPEGAVVRASYRKPDGKRGVYNLLPNGDKAWSVSGEALNILTVAIAPQVLTVVGQVKFTVSLILGNAAISTFPVVIDVAALPGFGGKSENYYSVSGLPQITEADNGKVLTVVDGMWVAANPTGGDGSGGQGGTTVIQSDPVISGKWIIDKITQYDTPGTFEQEVKFQTMLAIYKNDEGDLVLSGQEEQIVSYHKAVCSKIVLMLEEGMAGVSYTVESTDEELQAVLDALDTDVVGAYLGMSITLGGTWFPDEAKVIDFGGAQEVSKEFLDAFKIVASLYYGNTGIAAEGEVLSSISVTEAADGTVTMVNKLESGSETIVIGADANGNPASVTVNGTAIPVEWTAATTEETTEVETEVTTA